MESPVTARFVRELALAGQALASGASGFVKLCRMGFEDG